MNTESLPFLPGREDQPKEMGSKRVRAALAENHSASRSIANAFKKGPCVGRIVSVLTVKITNQ